MMPVQQHIKPPLSITVGPADSHLQTHLQQPDEAMWYTTGNHIEIHIFSIKHITIGCILRSSGPCSLEGTGLRKTLLFRCTVGSWLDKIWLFINLVTDDPSLMAYLLTHLLTLIQIPSYLYWRHGEEGNRKTEGFMINPWFHRWVGFVQVGWEMSPSIVLYPL